MIVKAMIGNLIEEVTTNKYDCIMNAANGVGPMGRGIAGAIRACGGTKIQTDAFRVCKEQKPKQGHAYSTIAGTLPVKRIIHAVTMRKPNDPTSLEVVEGCFTNALLLAEKYNYNSIICTALGTGVGGLNNKEVAEVMVHVSKDFDIDITMIDFNVEFIDKIRSLI